VIKPAPDALGITALSTAQSQMTENENVLTVGKGTLSEAFRGRPNPNYKEVRGNCYKPWHGNKRGQKQS